MLSSLTLENTWEWNFPSLLTNQYWKAKKPLEDWGGFFTIYKKKNFYVISNTMAACPGKGKEGVAHSLMSPLSTYQGDNRAVVKVFMMFLDTKMFILNQQMSGWILFYRWKFVIWSIRSQIWIIQCILLNKTELKGQFQNFIRAIKSCQYSLASESKYFWTYLFQFKDVLIEVVLQALVGKVNAELFKAIVFIVFKSKNIKHPNGQSLQEK